MTPDPTQWSKLVPELTVTQLAASLQFYVDVLGFVVLFTRDDPPFAYLEFEGAQFMLEELHEGGWRTGDLVKPYGRGINFQIECVDAAAIYDKIVTAGYTCFRPLNETWYPVNTIEMGAREFLVQDPDGYLLRFSQDLGERP
jgi:catechol 2,3-dioxygenase-like lactoylglutathione lyase family enzyme